MKMSKKLIIILAIVLVVAIIGCAVLLVLLLNKDEPTTPPLGGVVYDPNQGDYVTPDGGVAQNGVAIPGFGTWTIPPNVTEVTTDFYNPEANKDKYYLTYEVRIPNDSAQGYEVIYKSGAVEAGKHIQKVTISRSFEKGEYDAYLFVQPYRIDSQTPTNNANIKFKLIVK